VPEGTSKQDILGRLQLAKHPAAPMLMKQMASQQALDHTSGLGKFNAGMGLAFTNIGRGAKQMLGMDSDYAENKGADRALMRTGAGAAGNVAGNIAAFAPLSVVPGANTVAGAGALGATVAAFQPTENAQERLTNMGTGGALGAGTQALAGPIAQRVGEWGADRQAAATARQSQNSVADETLRRGREAGFVVPPSAVNPTGTNRILESIGGKADVGQEAVHRNTSALDAIGRRSAGISENEPLSREALRAARQRMAEPYREIAALSPQAAADLEALKAARFESKLQWRGYNQSGNPELHHAASAADAEVNRLANSIEQAASGAGRQDLVQALTQARQNIARNRQVQEAVNVGSGHLDPAVLGRALDRGAPLTGELETVGRMQQAFPQFLKDASGKQAAGTSALHAWIAATGAGVGGHLAGPAGAVAGASLPYVAPPVARSIALSGPYQRAMGTPNYSPGMAANAAATLENPETRRRAALLARALALPAIPQAVNQ
jgi:hypothetical protein